VRNVARRRTERCRVEPVVDERSPERELPARVAGGRGKCGEVAVQHRCAGNKSLSIGRIRPDECALVTAKEKEPVLHNRSAKRSAYLMTLETVFLRRKIVSCLEPVVAQEFKYTAVHFVCAGVRHGRD